MIGIGKAVSRKYFKIELLLLLFTCYIAPVFSDIEYSGYVENNIWNFTADLEYRLVYGTFSMILFSSYYWLALKPLVFKQQIIWLTLSIIGFIIAFHLSNKYEHWLVTKLPFVSATLQAKAGKDFAHYTAIHFIITYALTRLVFTFLGFAFLIRLLQQNEEVKDLREQQLTSELNYLKAQMQPHFFFNTLNNIYALAIRQSKDTAPVVAMLADMMRYILYEAEGHKVPLSRELRFLENYVDLERIRHAGNIKINLEVQGNINNYTIEPLLLLPLVENAFKHGIQEEMNSGYVNMVLCITETDIILQVENSKPKDHSHVLKGGMGLINLKKRLDLLYASRYQLQIEDSTDSHQVILTLQTI